jgi:hypothetical protein
MPKHLLEAIGDCDSKVRVLSPLASVFFQAAAVVLRRYIELSEAKPAYGWAIYDASEKNTDTMWVGKKREFGTPCGWWPKSGRSTAPSRDAAMKILSDLRDEFSECNPPVDLRLVKVRVKGVK